MKIYSVAWGWTPAPEDVPSGNSLEVIADRVKALGYDGVDYLATYEALDSFYTAETCVRVGKHCADLGLAVGGVAFQSDLWNDPDKTVCDRQLAYFTKCADAAKLLGAGSVSCIIPRPFGANYTRANRSPSEKLTSNLPAGYRWDADWSRFTSMLQSACDIAAAKGLDIALECFPRSLCSTPDAMRNVLKDVNRSNFGIQLDTAHLMNQNIDIETAIYMLEGGIRHVHLKDSDGTGRGNLPAGWGLVDFSRVFRALEDTGYTGNASVEVEFTDDPARYMREALRHVKMCLSGTF